MAVDPRTPCLIGVGQHTWRPEAGTAPEPLVMWEDVALRAANDTSIRGGSDAVLGRIESLGVVFCQSWSYDDPARRLAEALDIHPKHRFYSGIGGTTPQQLVDDAAERILRGEIDVAMVVGGEALDTRRRLTKEGRKPDWRFKDPERKPFPFEAPFHDAEVAHEVFQAWLTFALWDVARRAHLAVAPDDYRRRLGELMTRFTAVAADNPNAWFPVERSVDELITSSAQNRMVGYPYTKYLVSVMNVDMAACVIVASEQAADEMRVPRDRRVYVRGWCYAEDPVYVAEHDPTWASPAMRAASGEALAGAGIGIDDVAHLDLYSCFASSVNFALDALGLSADDPRGFTVTGGLPYFGGPGSNYVTHSIVSMAQVLRDNPGDVGLVTGVGMHLTKHVFGVYSTEPGPVSPPDEAGVQARLDAAGKKGIVERHTGPATIVSYTVVHTRDGEPQWGLVICDVDSATRCYGRVEDQGMLAAMEAAEWVGATVDLVAGDDGVNRVGSAEAPGAGRSPGP
jgi:acetyl-CoA C-acetyltransferase